MGVFCLFVLSPSTPLRLCFAGLSFSLLPTSLIININSVGMRLREAQEAETCADRGKVIWVKLSNFIVCEEC